MQPDYSPEQIQEAYRSAEQVSNYLETEQGRKDLKEIVERSRLARKRLKKVREIPWQRLHQPMTI